MRNFEKIINVLCDLTKLESHIILSRSKAPFAQKARIVYSNILYRQMCYEIEEVAALMGNTPQSIRNYIKDHEEMISNNPSYQDLFINVLKKIE